ncbi:hypothetical protein OVY01_15915 [Robbsia sp. Bb-Pol-6]|uniref:Uncharacterized protein n=1 Tax=Robbsia betulipollinis TaxID=2981849 RepID=A0ABT3ZS09_9BURK|nr:hypothetical protein [Robbsia betulipollinis]MCY0388668.1 hypothetical protein [Robbsia betulipollinis]
MIDGINKALAHLADVLRNEKPAAIDPAHHEPIACFAGSWHGDHLQNLTTCPMEGRRYFLEDWSQESVADEDTPRLDSFSGRPLKHHS